jgi:hypothetical protein
VLATPAVLRVHVHDRQVSQYARVDGPGWDEHTLDRFAPHTLVVLSRIIDYPSSDPLATALAVAPTCPVNEGTTHLVLRIAYDPADPRLPRSTIRVPTLYRPGLPSSVKNITIILVPNHKRSRDSVHHISEEPEWAPLDLTPAAKHYTPRLGMLDSTATWVAGYLPRGVKFTFVGVEELPETALNLPTGPAIRSANGLKAALLDSGAALSDAVRENIVRVRSHTSDHALDKAMGNLSLLSLAEYEATMGKAGFALRAHD